MKDGSLFGMPLEPRVIWSAKLIQKTKAKALFLICCSVMHDQGFDMYIEVIEEYIYQVSQCRAPIVIHRAIEDLIPSLSYTLSLDL